MRDAAGQLPDGVHLLQMRSLPLRALERRGRFLLGGHMATGDINQPLARGHGPLQPAP